MDTEMDKIAANRELVYGIPKNDRRDTHINGQDASHPLVGKVSQLLHHAIIMPMKTRSKKTTIAIPPITAHHRRTAVGHPDIGHIVVALRTRAKLRLHCRRVADFQAVVALINIILMIIAEEIIFHLDPTQARSNEPTASIVLKSVIGFLSIIQFILALMYWESNLALVNLDNDQPQSWRLALSRSRIVLIVFELLIIVVLPYPGFNRHTLNSNETHTADAYVPPDVAVSLPMFLRLYFIYRAVILHTQVMQNVGTGPIGYMNNIHFNFQFITRVLLKKYAFQTLIGLWVGAFVIGSWIYRACEFHKDTGHLTYSLACWLYCVTFTTVGYGDLHPNTDGGRFLSGVVGLWGVISVALATAVIQQHLQMDGSERYVFEYNTRLEINKERKYYIGNIIKFTVKAWYLRVHNKDKKQEYQQAERKVYRAVDKIRSLRQEQSREFVEDDDEGRSNEQQMDSEVVKDIRNRLDRLDAKLEHLVQLVSRQPNIDIGHDAFPIIQRL